MPLLDYRRLARTEAVRRPFAYLVARDVLAGENLAAVVRDFPRIAKPGLFPVKALDYGLAFAALIDELRGPALTALLAEKLGVDLAGRPLMVTVRGRCRTKDGRVHTDSERKLAAALLYLNPPWRADGGRLRLLASESGLAAPLAEVAPDGGTLVAFRRTASSFHGHLPFSGERRYVMLNWMRDEAACRRELARHRLSAGVKWLLGRSVPSVGARGTG